METRTTAERPPKQPTLSLARQNTGASYVERFKIQKERIKTLHQDEENKANKNQDKSKSLPKISQPPHKTPRDDSVVKKFIRSNTLLDRMKLPGVAGSTSYAQVAARRRQPVPLKTFQMRLNPEHTSYLSKSLSSLPSIPGSPSQDDGVSPMSERRADFKGQSFPGRHWYQKIAFQKTLHGGDKPPEDSSARSGKDRLNKEKSVLESVYSGAMPKRSHRHKLHAPKESSEYGKDDIARESSSTISHVRYRRVSRESGISDTRSEGNYMFTKKWKDNCDCLRCQMLKREYREGDEHYKLWGQYPCHRIETGTRLDDDL